MSYFPLFNANILIELNDNFLYNFIKRPMKLNATKFEFKVDWLSSLGVLELLMPYHFWGVLQMQDKNTGYLPVKRKRFGRHIAFKIT